MRFSLILFSALAVAAQAELTLKHLKEDDVRGKHFS